MCGVCTIRFGKKAGGGGEGGGGGVEQPECPEGGWVGGFDGDYY